MARTRTPGSAQVADGAQAGEEAGTLPSATPRLGAFVMIPRAGTGPIDDLLFDWELRHPGTPPPAWQERLHQRVIDAINSVLDAEIDLALLRDFLGRLRNTYSALCVQMPAATREPAATRPYVASLDDLERMVAGVLDERIAGTIKLHLKWSLPFLVLLAAAGTALLLEVPDREVAANFLLAGAAALGGMVASDNLLKLVDSPEAYVRIRRQLRNPFGRILTTVFLAAFACAALGTGLVDISVGKAWHSKDVGHDTVAALVVGFLSGWPGSFLGKRIMALISGDKAAGPKKAK